MPNKKSAKKELRKSRQRADRNTATLNNLSKLRKQTAKAVLAKDPTLQELAAKTTKALDKAAGKGLIKSRAASRAKSRLQKKLNALGK